MASGLKSRMTASPHLTSVISGRERMETEKPAPLPFCGGLQKATGVAGGVAKNSPSISGQILNIAGNRVERWRQDSAERQGMQLLPLRGASYRLIVSV